MPEPDPPFRESFLGVVFDLDGTLITSHHDFPKMRAAVVLAAERHGAVPGRLRPGETVVATMRAGREALAAAGATEPMVFRFEAEVHQLLDAIEMEALPTVAPRAGANALLAELHRQEYRLAILTRASERFARAALIQTGLEPYFPYLRSRSSLGPSKPSPEALEILLREMGVPSNRAVLVGDHPMDGETAAGARVRFHAVLPDPREKPDARTSERLRTSGAASVSPDLPSLAERLGLPPLAVAPSGRSD